MFAIQTRRLGDAIHAYAVVAAGAAGGGPSVFSVHADHAPLFAGSKLTLILSKRGTTWVTPEEHGFRGPQHGEHVRLTMARAAGFEVNHALLSVRLDHTSAPAERSYVVICPDTAVRYKEWPDGHWAKLVEYLVSSGFPVTVCRAPGRPPMFLPAGTRQVDASLAELAKLISSAAFVVGTDSGHVHLADALGVPVVGLYGATSAVTYGPFRDASLCIDTHRHAFPMSVRYSTALHARHRAMQAISVDAVMRVISTIPSPIPQKAAT